MLACHTTPKRDSFTKHESVGASIVLTLATGATVAAATFQATLNKLVADRVSRAFDFGSKDDVKKYIAPHLDATYKKCIRIKTLLNPQTQSDFLEIYSTQRFSLGDSEMDHYGLVDYIRDEPRNIIITGSGGSGKSMFMRYLLALTICRERRPYTNFCRAPKSEFGVSV